MHQEYLVEQTQAGIMVSPISETSRGTVTQVMARRERADSGGWCMMREVRCYERGMKERE